MPIQKHTEKHPIDVVILWVDGDDNVHKNKIKSYIKNTRLLHEKGFRTRYDQVNEIEFTVNSILKYASFIRNIYIITDNQTPSFLAKKDKLYNYKNVSIIDHSVIFSGFERYLPTFNSQTIETCLYRVPDLSEHFIYFNDDFFLANKTTREDFFIDGKPVLRGKWRVFDEDKFYNHFRKIKHGHKKTQQRTAKIIGFKKYYYFRHTPHPLRRSTFINYFENNNDLLTNNIKHRFRNPEQFISQGLANHIEIKNGTCILKSDYQLIYLRSYKKPLLWYKYLLNKSSNKKYLFLSMQSLDLCPPSTLDYILNWLRNRLDNH